jgi:hypothetical protein
VNWLKRTFWQSSGGQVNLYECGTCAALVWETGWGGAKEKHEAWHAQQVNLETQGEGARPL